MKAFVRYIVAAVLVLLCMPLSAQQRGHRVVCLESWEFSKDQFNWSRVTVPHSCNAIDGHSPAYYRGKAYYKTTLTFKKEDVNAPMFLLFEGAAQSAEVYVNSKHVATHRGGYTPFVVNLHGLVRAGDNEVRVMCDNHEDVNLIPVSSDFNKNNGLHNPVHLLQMNDVYASPTACGIYRMHVSTPEVSPEVAQTRLTTELVNDGTRATTVNVTYTLKNAEGEVCYRKTVKQKIPAASSLSVEDNFDLKNPHLWDGLDDPYLYDAIITISKGKKVLDEVSTKVGYRYYEMTSDKGFYLNGHSFPLRGVSEHQDLAERASAMMPSDYDRDYEIIKELGCNMLRLAHYPHSDYEFRKCDSLGIIVQTEIPWVNVCGINADQGYYDNIRQQMGEMITNLYNHPSIVFWGIWNELNSWGNKPEFQGKFDAERVLKETNDIYHYAKRLDPYRKVGFSDDSRLHHAKWADSFEVDYVSENLYNGWYQRYGDPGHFTDEVKKLHGKKCASICNISEYGAGVNPFCHTTDTTLMLDRDDDTRHYEEYGNWIHESHLQQIAALPYLNFTTAWVLFDFAVAARQEGYVDSPDGVSFTDNPARKYTNDKGLVTRDRKVKKDVFYLYKAAWNHKETTVYITSRRMTHLPSGKPVKITVYSNAKSLTLYRNGEAVETMNSTGENTGVIWKFKPLEPNGDRDTFMVVSDNGTTDQVTWNYINR